MGYYTQEHSFFGGRQSRRIRREHQEGVEEVGCKEEKFGSRQCFSNTLPEN
jgi:hypothetical protein